MRDETQEKKAKEIMIGERGSVILEGAGSRESPVPRVHVKTPMVAPWDLPSLSLGQLPQVQVDPSIPRLTHISRLHPDHTIGGARQAPDAGRPGSMCGRPRSQEGGSEPSNAVSVLTSALEGQHPALFKHPPPRPPASGLSHCPDREPGSALAAEPALDVPTAVPGFFQSLSPVRSVFPSVPACLSWASSGVMPVFFPNVLAAAVPHPR